jgi:hypothetical protein
MKLLLFCLPGQLSRPLCSETHPQTATQQISFFSSTKNFILASMHSFPYLMTVSSIISAGALSQFPPTPEGVITIQARQHDGASLSYKQVTNNKGLLRKKVANKYGSRHIFVRQRPV